MEKETEKTILKRSPEKLIKIYSIMKEYLKQPGSFRTYCRENGLANDRQCLEKLIDSFEKFGKEVGDFVNEYREHNALAIAEEDKIYSEILNGIVEKVGDNPKYDIIKYYEDYGQYSFVDLFELSLRASKLSKKENIIINSVIGKFINIKRRGVFTSEENLLEGRRILPLYDVDGVKVGEREYSIDEKKDAIYFMKQNNVPFDRVLFDLVLKSALTGAITIERSKKKTKGVK